MTMTPYSESQPIWAYKHSPVEFKPSCSKTVLIFSLCSVSICAVEIATLTRENGKTRIKVLKQKEVEELIKKHEAEEAKAEKDKKEKEQKEKDK